jgi:hypothetical protein
MERQVMVVSSERSGAEQNIVMSKAADEKRRILFVICKLRLNVGIFTTTRRMTYKKIKFTLFF